MAINFPTDVNMNNRWIINMGDPSNPQEAATKNYVDTRTYYKALISNATTSSTTAVNTNLAFPIAANEVWVVRVDLTASKATSSTGLKLAVGAPTGCTVAGFAQLGGATLAAPLVPSLVTAINTLGTTFATGIGIQVAGTMSFRVTNSSTAGNITLQFATVTSNTATIYAGSSISANRAVNV